MTSRGRANSVMDFVQLLKAPGHEEVRPVLAVIGSNREEKTPGAKRLDYCGGDRRAGIDRPPMILIESDLAWSLAIDNPSLPQVGRCFATAAPRP